MHLQLIVLLSSAGLGYGLFSVRLVSSRLGVLKPSKRCILSSIWLFSVCCLLIQLANPQKFSQCPSVTPGAACLQGFHTISEDTDGKQPPSPSIPPDGSPSNLDIPGWISLPFSECIFFTLCECMYLRSLWVHLRSLRMHLLQIL